MTVVMWTMVTASMCQALCLAQPPGQGIVIPILEMRHLSSLAKFSGHPGHQL